MTDSSFSLSAASLPGGAVYTTIRRSLPGTVRTSQSGVTGPTSGWRIVLRADWCAPTAPVSHSSANRVLAARRSADEPPQTRVLRVPGRR